MFVQCVLLFCIPYLSNMIPSKSIDFDGIVYITTMPSKSIESKDFDGIVVISISWTGI